LNVHRTMYENVSMPLIALDARKYHDFGTGTYIQHLIPEYASIQSFYAFSYSWRWGREGADR
jgi:hypothetical protein